MKKIIIAMLALLCGTMVQAAEKETVAMMQEKTLSIIKPDAVAANHIGQIIARFEKAGLKVVAAKMTKLSKSEAERFYLVHKDRPFYKDLVAYMSSGPIFVQVLEGEDAVIKNRDLMGATNPKNADKGTIRADFGTDVQSNAVHGSDSQENAKKEISFFFKKNEIYPR
jgi:nucleoside-diphosphate kinase